MRYKALVSYDGGRYHGFQRQKNATGIQTLIERALRLMTQTDIKIQSAGRTDKGVHALGQVFHFDAEPELDGDTWVRAINDRLPPDIRILDVKPVSDRFHARYDAKAKIYRYVIAKQPSTAFTQGYEVYVRNFAIEPVRQALPMLVGTHDFKGFSKQVGNKDTTKTIFQADVKETKKHYVFTFKGNGFLKYMVRSIMGTLIEIGQGKLDPDVVNDILETQNRSLAGDTAEAKGLFLVKINY
ncbi:MAG: tRNA pseudouridine(38-40) synthase TruA [Acholeplasmataceae bacterium]|nr:MAG: tRNA pseudouridine(38-40) synthase TruA [Acholeplasmataceae bacterium]